MKFKQSQIAALWVAEGGAPSKADLASAVSMAESGGDSKAGNSCCHGLWQLNVEVGVSSMSCATNPVCSTRKAISMSKNGRDWGPWEAYTNGSYAQFLHGSGKTPRTKKQAKSVLASFPQDLLEATPLDPFGPIIPGTPGIPDITNPLGALGELGDVVSFFKHGGELLFTEQGWLRLGKIFGGSILLLWGLRILVQEGTGTDPVRAATNTAKKAAEVAGTVAVVK